MNDRNMWKIIHLNALTLLCWYWVIDIQYKLLVSGFLSLNFNFDAPALKNEDVDLICELVYLVFTFIYEFILLFKH